MAVMESGRERIPGLCWQCKKSAETHKAGAHSRYHASETDAMPERQDKTRDVPADSFNYSLKGCASHNLK